MDFGEAARTLLAQHPNAPPALRYVLQSIADDHESLEVRFRRAELWLEELRAATEPE